MKKESYGERYMHAILVVGTILAIVQKVYRCRKNSKLFNGLSINVVCQK